jgi:hypothetical protein
MAEKNQVGLYPLESHESSADQTHFRRVGYQRSFHAMSDEQAALQLVLTNPR